MFHKAFCNKECASGAQVLQKPAKLSLSCDAQCTNHDLSSQYMAVEALGV